MRGKENDTMKKAKRELRKAQGHFTLWETEVADIMLEIPRGRLATYGCIARIVGQRLNIQYEREPSRAVANLRMKLYDLLTHDTAFPLHRLASKGDLYGKLGKDSLKTQRYNKAWRKKEGTYRNDNPQWCPHNPPCECG